MDLHNATLILWIISNFAISNKMIIIWGYPEGINSQLATINMDWNICVSICYNNPRCVMAYSKSKTSTTDCGVYSVGSFSSVQLTTIETNIVALKTDSTNQCPNLSPGSFSVSVYGSTPAGKYVGSSSSDGKTISYAFSNSTNFCASDWTMFDRIKKPMCLKVFDIETYKEDNATKLCNKEGAVLAGIENKNESEWIHAQKLKNIPSGVSIGYIWIGLHRKNNCMIGSDYSPSCNPKTTNSFYWTDASVTGTDGMKHWFFEDGPSNENNTQETVKSCTEFTVDSSLNSPHLMALNNVQCELTKQQDNIMIGFVCAKDVDIT